MRTPFSLTNDGSRHSFLFKSTEAMELQKFDRIGSFDSHKDAELQIEVSLGVPRKKFEVWIPEKQTREYTFLVEARHKAIQRVFDELLKLQVENVDGENVLIELVEVHQSFHLLPHVNLDRI